MPLPVLPHKWKIQRVTPDTCDGAPYSGCVFWELFDSLAIKNGTTVIHYERICAGHSVGYHPAKGLAKWHTGNWKDAEELLAYQRAWFRWLNREEWLDRVARGEIKASEPIPPQIANMVAEPLSPPTRSLPSLNEQADIVRMHTWHRDHNLRLSLARNAAKIERPDIPDDQLIWSFTGNGDNRVLITDFSGVLSQSQKNRVRAAMNIQFGDGKVVVK